MFDLGIAELLIIGIVALIVVGPKDLPVMFRNVGRFVGRMRGMAREFSSAMNDAAEESGMRDVQKSLKAATNPVSTAMDGVRDAASDLTKIDLDGDSGPATAKMSDERADMSKKIQASTARAQADRMKKEAEAALQKAEQLEAELGQSASKSDT